MGWKEIPKTDAHVHIIPGEVHDANPDADDEFSFATVKGYQALMDEYNIRKAVIMPFNDPWLMSMGSTAEAVHGNLMGICGEDSRFSCFADVDVRNIPEETCRHIREAFSRFPFRGIKLHPNNSDMDIDDGYNDAVADLALELGCPVAVHSYPSSLRETDRDECCSPERIGRWMKRHPGLKVIVCHMGGFQWEDAVGLDAYFDISAVLPDYADRFGIKKTNEILREFGAGRLLFATDWPCSRSLGPASIMDRYMDILDQTDFSEREMRMIAYGNAEKLLFPQDITDK